VATAKPALLSGGNPQIPKAEGNAPVQAYIAALPGWKRVVGKRLDALIVRAVPNVRKAVKWNSPFYGMEGQGWFLSFHAFTHYLKVTFFNGTSLRPVPRGGTSQDARWVDVREDDLDEAQMTAWVKQAAAMPGWDPAKTKPKAAEKSNASGLIDRRIRELGGWRGETLARMRTLILEADPRMTEEWKWDVPVWSHDGIVCTGEAYSKVVKLTFAHGASLPDPSRLFNSSLEGKTRRAIDIREGDTVNARAFQALVKAAVARNRPAAASNRSRSTARR
jgi:hypothetical protein